MNNRILALSGLRPFLLFYIVCFHSYPLFTSEQDPFFYYLSPRSFCTDLFFILSGYILTFAYVRKGRLRTSASEFIVARLAKIYPLLAASVVVMLVFNHFKYGNTLFETLLDSRGWTQLLLVDAWIPYWFGINPPAWTAGALFLMYLLYPLFVKGIYRTTKTQSLWLLGTILLLNAVVAALMTFTDWSANETVISVFHKNPLLKIPEFLCGMLLFKITQEYQLNQPQRRPAFQITYLFLFIFLFFLSQKLFVSYDLNLTTRKFFTVVSLGLMLGLTTEQTAVRKWLENPFLVRLGDSSLSIFLVHWPLAMLFLAVVERLEMSAMWMPSRTIFFVIYLGLVYSFSDWLQRKWLEPLSKSIKAFFFDVSTPPRPVQLEKEKV